MIMVDNVECCGTCKPSAKKIKFVVLTKDPDPGKKPFENAVREVVTYHDRRAWASVDDASATRRGAAWLKSCKAVKASTYDDGTPCLIGDVEREEWVVEVPDLDTLTKMIAPGNYVVGPSDYKEYPLAIYHEWFFSS